MSDYVIHEGVKYYPVENLSPLKDHVVTCSRCDGSGRAYWRTCKECKGRGLLSTPRSDDRTEAAS